MQIRIQEAFFFRIRNTDTNLAFHHDVIPFTSFLPVACVDATGEIPRLEECGNLRHQQPMLHMPQNFVGIELHSEVFVGEFTVLLVPPTTDSGQEMVQQVEVLVVPLWILTQQQVVEGSKILC